MKRYLRNRIITADEQKQLKEKKVAVIGCGGLGGYVIEMLARIGIGYLTVADGDVFEESNLNRQLLCVMHTLGKKKSLTARKRIQEIDPSINVNVVDEFINKDNIIKIIKGHDVVIDALDSNAIRCVVMEACKTVKIPCVHGAIAGWYGQVSVVFPEDNWLGKHLMTAREKGIEKNIGNPSFTPACIASHQVCETLKVLLKKDVALREKIMFIDMLENEIEIIKP
jgi:molybdopterin/thiamine biosynthesis adenylyltransferase